MKICGAARIGSRTKHLVRKLLPGDIAVIRHRDIDEVAALSLIDCRVSAVINIDSSITGNYPNNGPLKLWEAKIWHLDQVGENPEGGTGTSWPSGMTVSGRKLAGKDCHRLL